MTKTTVTTKVFDIADLPAGVVVCDTLWDAFKTVYGEFEKGNGHALSLVDIAGLCERNGFPASASERDYDKFIRWKKCVNEELKTLPPPPGYFQRDAIQNRLDIHVDATLVSALMRINSATLFCTPTDSRKVQKIADQRETNKAVAKGEIQLFVPPQGYLIMFGPEAHHAMPTTAINDDVMLQGPHWPDESKEPDGVHFYWRIRELKTLTV